MKNDPNEQKMRELSWRRNRTPAEDAELRTWLAAHPEARLNWETDAELSALLERLPNVPVSSNFTARVLQTLDATATQSASPHRAVGWWHRLIPRLTGALLLVSVGFLVFQNHQFNQRKKLVQTLSAVADVNTLSNPVLLQDFEAIRRLPSATTPDRELLALMQ